MTDKELLEVESDYLISAFGQTTATGLSALLDGQVSHDQVQGFLDSPKRRSADVWQIVKPHVHSVQHDDGVLILDESIAEKPSTKVLMILSICRIPLIRIPIIVSGPRNNSIFRVRYRTFFVTGTEKREDDMTENERGTLHTLYDQSPVNDGNRTINRAALLADMEQVFTEAPPRLLRLAYLNRMSPATAHNP